MAKNKIGKAACTVIKREIETAVMRDREQFSALASSVITSMALVSLHDEFGFGSKRLERFQKKLEMQADCLIDGYVSIQDLQQLSEELKNKISTYK